MAYSSIFLSSGISLGGGVSSDELRYLARVLKRSLTVSS